MKTWVKISLWAAGIAGTALLVRRALRERRRIEFLGRVVVITGGSRGLGLVLARQFADEGAKLVLLARDAEALARAVDDLEAQGAEVLAVPCDVTDEAQVHAAIDVTLERYGRIDVLVHAAGVIGVGPFDTMRNDDYRRSLAIHGWAPLFLATAVAGAMRRQGGGRIVNVASIGGRVAIPHLLPYTMGKFALAGLSDGLRLELARDNIRVTTVFPGLMRTGSHVRAEFKGDAEREYAWFAVGNASVLASTSAEAAARRILRACRYGDAELIITPQAKLLAKARALFPHLTQGLLTLAARFLPEVPDHGGHDASPGWHNRGGRVQQFLTRRSDRAIDRNNERPLSERSIDEPWADDPV